MSVRHRGHGKKDGHEHAKSSKQQSPGDSKQKKKKSRGPLGKLGSIFVLRGWRLSLLIGIVLGICAAIYYMQYTGKIGFDDISLNNFKISHRDLLPRSILEEFDAMTSSSSELSDSFEVGAHLAGEGYSAKHPVVLVPGVISTSLESWSVTGTEECPSKPHYRKRLWGSWYMIRTMFTDKKCWLQHLMLDNETGLDPPGIRLRAAQGMEAADFFMSGFWLWSKIIENLSALGYDTNNMSVAAYDWRLGFPDLERRDRYFSMLKRQIELNSLSSGQKTVLAGHSMGSQVIFYFFKWVEAEGFGDGGKSWVNDHIEAFVDISGSMLGTPKASSALLSGEMRDTVQLNSMAVYGLEKFFGRHERRDLALSFPGVAAMIPKGGDAVWGTLDSAPDDILTNGSLPSHGSYGKFLRFSETKSAFSEKNLTAAETTEYLLNLAPEWYRKRANSMFSHGLAKTRAEVTANENDPSKWVNPLEVALPNAPDLKIYCFYGVGKPTERAYTYQDSSNDTSTPLNVTMEYGSDDSVVSGEGDGTVSLLTHLMCHKWQEKDSKFNPAGSEVKIVEMLHQPDKFDLRGGAKTAEHVDILGRTELNELLLRVAAGHGAEISPRLESNLTKYAEKIDLGE
ncbi:Phospholipid:diacylglycerol acyltransferase [Wickerhamiella sorbophila]|uniref:Phospholipid:diacylglycerol acyltransferase n=1 Tax=Wickerhamiella sorbophila TaxID=45607 RepID=A0A2T0FND0_9ASCO|nr:Phospholipid:diacylglycerol acyltransferase [Wickerhamiella sorbophila]PRT56501.1 Phospholipid:diacylglycerol acyltransferase [Wickerhamiella sorbophila]